MNQITNLLFFLSLLAFSSTQAQEDEWDVNNPPYAHDTTTFNVSEGTWMNLDVSPDGQTIAFDLLGDIYTLPINGGKATAIRTGLAWEVQPRFSPDGKLILFTSDAGGGDNIWTMKTDGTNAKQITKEDFRLLNNPTWMPDGEYFIARKHFTSERSAGAGEMWMYHISGGDGIQITERKNDQQDVNEPSVSADGKYLYFSEDVYPGGFFQYNKDPNSQIYVTKRYDFEKGEIANVVGGPGGAARPQINHKGDRLAYVRRVRTKSVLYIRDLKTGMDFPVYDALSKDQQEAWAIFGVYPGFNWTPDDQHIVIWAGGKIRKVNVENKNATVIPFEVEATHQMAKTVRFKQTVFEDAFRVNVLRQAITSPDAEYLVFNAIGHLYKMKLPKGKIERLTDSRDFEFAPTFSPDGKSIYYVTWDDINRGAIMKMDWGSGALTKLSTDKGIYNAPHCSPDGKSLVYRKDSGNGHQGYAYTVKPGIYIMDIAKKNEKFVTAQGSNPMFTPDGEYIYFQTGGQLFGSLTKSLKRVSLDGEKVDDVLETKYANRFQPSPDGKWLAFSELHKVYITPMPTIGKKVGLSSSSKSVPVQLVARDAGINIHWSADSKKLHWTLGPEYFTAALENRFPFLGKVDTVPPVDTTGIFIDFTMASDRPKGMLALTNATIITMEGDEILNSGTVIIENNQIKSVGQSSEIKIPKNATEIDCTGKIIMPGFVDVHAHLGAFRYGLSPKKHWQYWANLAYGVTTTHDPSSNSEMTFSQSEMVKAGIMVGPRIFSTGTILYGADGDFKAVINSLDDARSALRRTKAYGAFSVKSYNQPRRNQRQQVIKAAQELGINVYPEGGSHFFHNMTMVADGHTGVEHNIPVAPLYDDVMKFWSSTNTGNTPTLIVNYGGINGEFYYYERDDVWAEERLNTFTPRPILDSRARHRMKIPQEEYNNGHILVSESCNKLQQAGVNINLGSHGQLQGLGAHWELWMLVQGGMKNHQALRAATMNGATYLGMDDEIGSIKAGKLADLIVLDKNPLENIENSNSVKYTIINGRIYDAATMNEIGNRNVAREKFYWEEEGSNMGYPFFLETMSHMEAQCSCRH
jgi:imidazolonepropionase-like amidohydrolase/Tol biopolymer transport system component